MSASDDRKPPSSNTFLAKLRSDGVVRPVGLSTAAVGGVFLAFIPLTTWLAQPNTLLSQALTGVCRTLAYISTFGRTSSTSSTGKLAALSTLYIAFTYAFSGAASAAGTDAACEEGRDNSHPRKQVERLSGLPLRLHSAHYNLMEMFPGFALSAALTQAMAPGDEVLVNLLGLHVLCKVFVFWPAYVFNVAAPRSLAHVLATASVINVALRLSRKGIA